MGIESRAFVLGLGFLLLSQEVAALSWRVFVGREDCVDDFLPDNQYEMLKGSFDKRGEAPPEDFLAVVEAGFLVANRYGGETAKGSVDVWVKNPAGKVVYTKGAVKEDEFTVDAKGSKGPWQLCFRISKEENSNQHALTIELSYFTVNLRALVGTDHEWTKGPSTIDVGSGSDVNVNALAKGEELTNMKGSLQQLNIHLNTIKRQQRYIKMRTERHIKTINSTYGRTLWWSFFEAFVLVSASLVQVFAVRHFFSADKRMLRV